MTRINRIIALVLTTVFALTNIALAGDRWQRDYNRGVTREMRSYYDRSGDHGYYSRGYETRDRGDYRRRNDRPIISTGGAAVVGGAVVLGTALHSVFEGKTKRHNTDTLANRDIRIAEIEANKEIELAKLEAKYGRPINTRKDSNPEIEIPPVGAGHARNIDANGILHVEVPASMRCITAVNQTGHDLMISVEGRQVMGVLKGQERSYCDPGGGKITDVGAYQWRGAREAATVHFSDDPVDYKLEQGDDDPYVRIIIIPLED